MQGKGGAMADANEFRIRQIVDNGKMIQLFLVENVNTEPISQKQMIREKVAKTLDSDTRGQVMPLLDAILQAQPTINMRSYQQTAINITMPSKRYEQMGRPQVGQIVAIDMSVKKRLNPFR